jgi:hypothetical protein
VLTKAEYICADQPVTSFFACDKAADHTCRGRDDHHWSPPAQIRTSAFTHTALTVDG